MLGVGVNVTVFTGETVNDGTLDDVLVMLGVTVEVGGVPVTVSVIVGDTECVGEIVKVLVAVYVAVYVAVGVDVVECVCVTVLVLVNVDVAVGVDV
jgi:hypothetical protein